MKKPTWVKGAQLGCIGLWSYGPWVIRQTSYFPSCYRVEGIDEDFTSLWLAMGEVERRWTIVHGK